jgi:FAD-dependent urate hydroxylase
VKINSSSIPFSQNNKVFTETCEVAVLGAGPYGLSVGAHLKARGVECRVFGRPMEFWEHKMPEGMLLRSPRCASNLSDPDHAFTLEAYEAAEKREPRAPLPLSTFVEYGKWFRHQLESSHDTREVEVVRQDPNGFHLRLRDGDQVRARKVVVATGIGPFKKRPDVFKNFSAENVTHCYDGREVKKYSGKRVVVIGAGQSSLESAALLHEAGAEVEIIVRKAQVHWIGQHKWLHHLGPISSLMYSSHDVGPAGISRLVAYPKLMSYVPLSVRDRIRTRAVRSAGSAWLPARLKDVKFSIGRSVVGANQTGSGLRLNIDDGSERQVDHVVLGTGYRVDISQYDFLPEELVRKVDQFDGYPRLKRGFETSLPGLHFIGATAARSFGPLLYFVAGTEFAARELTANLLESRK